MPSTTDGSSRGSYTGSTEHIQVVDCWSDIGCPWAALAVHRFRAARAAHGLDGQIVLRHRVFPLELINRRGTPRQTLDDEVGVLNGIEPGLNWNPWGADPSLYPASLLLPLEAVQAAQFEDVGGLQASEDLDAALRRAFYGDSRQIQLHTEILAVAEECARVDASALARHLEAGTARAKVFGDFRSWREAGVQGSPHLIFPDGAHVHNPGVSIEWSQDAQGEWHVEVTSDKPAVYGELLAAATGGSS